MKLTNGNNEGEKCHCHTVIGKERLTSAGHPVLIPLSRGNSSKGEDHAHDEHPAVARYGRVSGG